MKTGPDPSTIYRIARYYYSEGLSQEEIAVKEGFSRSQISRLIDRARELGFVKITLVPPADLRTEELANELKDALGLFSVIVVPVRNTASAEEITAAIATRAADYLQDILKEFKVVGLGWGQTVYRTAELLPRGSGKGGGPFFVPLIGTSGDDNPNLQINTIIDRFSASFKSSGLFVNIPSVREMGAPLSKIEEKRISILTERWNDVEAAVIGLGASPSNSPNLIDELPQDYRKELKNSMSCGDILAHFFASDGTLFKSKYDYELLAFDIRRLPSLKKSICLAGGPGKHEGIVAAARSRYLSDLVTDEQTATAMLALLNGNLGKGGAPRSGAETL